MEGLENLSSRKLKSLNAISVMRKTEISGQFFWTWKGRGQL